MKELTLFDVGLPAVEEKKEKKKEAPKKSAKPAGTAAETKKPEKKPEVKVTGEWSIHFATESYTVNDFVEEIPEEGVTLEEVRVGMERLFNQFTAARTKWDVDEENNRLFPDAFAGSKGGGSQLRASFFPSLADCTDSQKSRSYVGGANGQIYEVRQSMIGQMVIPAEEILEYEPVKPGFRFGLKRIPGEVLGQIISFFKKYTEIGNFEVMIRVYYDVVEKEYVVECPKQLVTPVHIDCSYNPDYIGRNSLRYIPVLEIHSHNVMKAFFSDVDDEDEKRYGLYAVVGRLNTDNPEIILRAKANDSQIGVPIGEVFEIENLVLTDYPKDWESNVTVKGIFL